MKSAILVLIFATKVVYGYDQIYAINVGGGIHTGSDGIEYRGLTEGGRLKKYSLPFNIGNVPEADRSLYQSLEIGHSGGVPTIYQIPLDESAGDGFYALIVKFSSLHTQENEHTINMNINNIQVYKGVQQFELCDGFWKSCDKYFYFCVTGNTLHFDNITTVVRNNKFTIKFSSNDGTYGLAGFVLLKGSLGESAELSSPNINDTLYFDPKQVNAKCLSTVKPTIKPKLKHQVNRGTDPVIKPELELDTLKADIRQLKKATLKVQAEQASVKLQLSEITEQLNELRTLLLYNENTFYYTESVEPMETRQTEF